MTFDPGGYIGPHEAGFGQLFVPILGSGWVAGEDGERRPVSLGQAGYISRGEMHSKGSHGGMTALMVQVHDLGVTASSSTHDRDGDLAASGHGGHPA